MNKKVIAGAIGLVFISFAAMQYNDVDAWKWIVAYLLPAVLFILYCFGLNSAKAGRLLLIVYGCVALLYLPDFVKWVYAGFPSIVETMKAQKPYVEFVREFFGLIIISVSLVYYQKLIK